MKMFKVYWPINGGPSMVGIQQEEGATHNIYEKASTQQLRNNSRQTISNDVKMNEFCEALGKGGWSEVRMEPNSV